MRTRLNDGWQVRAPKGPFEPAPPDMRTVTLPHDALRDAERSPDAPSAGASAYFPGAAFTYLRELHAPAEWAQRRISLEFEAAYRHAMVFVNDELAGTWADGYGSFVVPIDAHLRYDTANEIRVEVRAYQDSRWYSGAGLIREVHLVDQPVAHLDLRKLRVTLVDVDDGVATVEVAARVRNDGRATHTATLTTRIADGDSAIDSDSAPVTVPPGECVIARQRLVVPGARLWSVDDPHRYVTTVRLDDEEVEVPTGLRTLKADPRRGLRINGESVLLRGACIHHDNGPLGAAAIARAEERRVELLKAAGFNAIRAAHNQLSPAMLEACDRVGMLVMNEAHDTWTRFKKPWDHAYDFDAWWERDLESLVDTSANHPSVIMYSLGNEIVEVGTPWGAYWTRRLAEHLRALDPTRLLTHGVNMALAVLDEVPNLLPGAAAAADGDSAGAGADAVGGQEDSAGPAAGLNDLGDMMNVLGSSDSATRRTIETHSVVDVAGFNYAEGRYVPDAQAFPHRVIVGSETFPTRIADLWALVTEHPHVIGDFTWTGWDYLGEVGIGATAYEPDHDTPPGLEREYPWLTARCGDLDITGHRMPVSYYREVVYGLRSEPYVAVQDPRRHGQRVVMRSPWGWTDAVGSWSWPGFEGRPMVVEVYADADEVELVLGGESVCRVPVGERLPFLAEPEIAWAPGELVAIAYRDGSEVGRTSVRSADGPLELRATADRGRIRADDRDLAYVALERCDAAGVLDPSAEWEVEVEVTGAGVLAGFASADPASDERFDGTRRTTYLGRALAVLRPTGPGTITLTARATGPGAPEAATVVEVAASDTASP